MNKNETKHDENLTPKEIEERVDRLVKEIVDSEDDGRFGLMYGLYRIVQTIARSEAVFMMEGDVANDEQTEEEKS